MEKPERFNPEVELEKGCCGTDSDCRADDINKYPEKPKTAMSRADVYKLIDSERDYQEKKQARWDDSDWHISDWVVFIRRYLKKIDDWTGHPKEQLDEMRKVAALAVVCMEHNHTRARKRV